jgi:4-amino-4-deoxychorismate lyase
MNPACWVNGEATAMLPAADRGLQYGDGLFETFAVKDGHIGLLRYHLERLTEGCGRLGIPKPSLETLAVELETAAKDTPRAVLKLILTRGSGGRGYRAPPDAVPSRVLSRYPWPDYPASWSEQGVRLRVCDIRLAEQPRLAGLKHLNRLEQVLARSEWRDADGYQEGLMLDPAGLAIEGTMSNVFAAPREGVLLTPDLGRCGVAGVMRRHVMDRARAEGVQVQVTDLLLAELMQCREIFLCNSLMGVWPVAELDWCNYRVGPMTRRAQAWAEASWEQD